MHSNNKIHQKYSHWYLLKTKPRQENRAMHELLQQNVLVFLPLCKQEKIIRGKVAIKEEPLFSNYLFVYLNTKNTNWTSIRSTRGVSRFVEFGNGPVKVSEEVVNELKNIIAIPFKPLIQVGEGVKIMGGPLKGLNAIYQARDGKSRAYVLLTFLQQKQSVSIENQFLSPT